MFEKLDDVDRIADRVIACAIEVHRTMGTGLLESIYEECMILECRRQGLQLGSNRSCLSTTKERACSPNVRSTCSSRSVSYCIASIIQIDTRCGSGSIQVR